MLNRLRSIKKRYWILGIIVLVIIFLVIGKKNGTELNTFVVEKTDVADTLLLAGTIDVDRRVELGFAASGRVKEVLVNEGEFVEGGDVIAVLDQNQLQANLIQAQANYTATTVNADADVVDAEDSFETRIAEQNTIVDNLYQEYLSGDLQAYIDKDTTRTLIAPTITGNYEALEEGLYRLSIYNSGAASGYSYQFSGLEEGTASAQTNQAAALGNRGLFVQFTDNISYGNTEWIIPVPNTRSSTYLARKNAYETAVATRDRIVRDSENTLNRVTESHSDISLAEAQKRQARASVQAVYSQLGDGKIIAPFDGVVAKNNLEEGEIVNAFQSLVTVVNNNQKELLLNIPEIYINKVIEGDMVEIVLDAYPEITYSGMIERIDIIDTLVDGVPVYETKVLVMDADTRMRIGMNARAQIITEEKKNVIAVPRHFVQENDEGSYVLIQQNGDLLETSVETGIVGNDGLVEIISGLSEGETVAYNGNKK